MQEYCREDGRKGNQLRRKEIRVGELTTTDGSAWLAHGGSSVIASVSGPQTARNSTEHHMRAVVEVKVTRSQNAAPSRGGVSRAVEEQNKNNVKKKDMELSTMLCRVFENEVIDTYVYPRCAFCIDVLIVSDDGSMSSVCANAIMCALLNAGIECRTTVSAISLLKVKIFGGDVNSKPSDVLLWLDPTKEEENPERRDKALEEYAMKQGLGPFMYTAVEVFFILGCGSGSNSSEILAMTAASSKCRNMPKAGLSIDELEKLYTIASQVCALGVTSFIRSALSLTTE